MADFFTSRLEGLEQASNFTNWLFEKYKHYLKGDILEISSGVGTYSKKITKEFGTSLTLSEFSDEQVNNLKQLMKGSIVHKLDLNNKMDFERIGYDKFDAIICSNVLEHVKNDRFALDEMYNMLKKSGILILIIPNNPKLYSEQDKILGHFRRYTIKEIQEKSLASNFKIIKIKYFNFIGILGWKITGHSNSKNHNRYLLKVFNFIIPTIKRIDDHFFSKLSGLSIIAILEK